MGARLGQYDTHHLNRSSFVPLPVHLSIFDSFSLFFFSAKKIITSSFQEYRGRKRRLKKSEGYK